MIDLPHSPRPLGQVAPQMPVIQPKTVSEMADTIRELAAAGKKIAIRGSGTKSGMGAALADAGNDITNASANMVLLKTGHLTGIGEYSPGELTITAGAGMTLAELTGLLAQNGQYLPFDPLYADSEPSATLGGTVSAGLSGPRRLRYGGLRDFVIGIHYLNSAGIVIKAGGKVVKNAAGYDYPKLFCGSLGTLGVITQVSFKVFPRPEASRTLLAKLRTTAALQSALLQVIRSKAEISAADAWRSQPPNAFSAYPQPDLVGEWTLAVQVDGLGDSLGSRLDLIERLLPTATVTTRIDGEAETRLWTALRDVGWIADPKTVVRFHLVPDQVVALDAVLDRFAVQRVYSLGGNAAWGAMDGNPRVLAGDLAKLGVKATIWHTTQTGIPEILPALPASGLVKRVKQAFDPDQLFYPGRYAT